MATNDLTNNCRICMASGNRMTSVFSVTIAAIDFMILSISSLYPVPGDNLPSQICETCLRRLEDAYLFRKKIIEANSTFLATQSNLHSTYSDNEYLSDSKNIFEISDDSNHEYIDVDESCDEQKSDTVPKQFQIDDTSILACGETEICSENATSYSGAVNNVINNTNERTTSSSPGKSEIVKSNIIQQSKPPPSGRPYICTYCGKEFVRKSNLDEHIRSHTGETPYPCRTCGKRYKGRKERINHERKHSGEKPFKCMVCEESFQWKRTYKHHMMKHTGEKPHKCELCGKGFKSKTEFRVHAKVHSGEKPYKCHCGKAFTQRCNLNKHITNIHS